MGAKGLLLQVVACLCGLVTIIIRALTWHGRGPVSSALPSVPRIEVLHLVDEPRPVWVESAALWRTLEAEGLSGLTALRRTFGSERILLGEASDFDISRSPHMRFSAIEAYVDKLLAGAELHTGGRVSETGGRAFFLDHPEIYDKLAKMYAEMLPEGYRQSQIVDLDDLRQALSEEDYDAIDMTLWIASKSYKYVLHTDIVPGTLLTHISGKKRITLFPQADAPFLYLKRGQGREHSGQDNWEEVSALDGDMWQALDKRHPRSKRFPLMQKASPMAIDLLPGTTLYIPCGWAHYVEYLGPAMSVSLNIVPDWLPDLLEEEEGWSPRACSDWHPDSAAARRASDPSGERSAEL